MKTFGLATVLALLLAAPAVAATDENIGISIETLLKDGWQIAGYAAANQSAVESAMILLQCGSVVPRAVPLKLRRNPQSKRQLALLQAASAMGVSHVWESSLVPGLVPLTATRVGLRGGHAATRLAQCGAKKRRRLALGRRRF